MRKQRILIIMKKEKQKKEKYKIVKCYADQYCIRCSESDKLQNFKVSKNYETKKREDNYK